MGFGVQQLRAVSSRAWCLGLGNYPPPRRIPKHSDRPGPILSTQLISVFPLQPSTGLAHEFSIFGLCPRISCLADEFPGLAHEFSGLAHELSGLAHECHQSLKYYMKEKVEG